MKLNNIKEDYDKLDKKLSQIETFDKLADYLNDWWNMNFNEKFMKSEKIHSIDYVLIKQFIDHLFFDVLRNCTDIVEALTKFFALQAVKAKKELEKETKERK